MSVRHSDPFQLLYTVIRYETIYSSIYVFSSYIRYLKRKYGDSKKKSWGYDGNICFVLRFPETMKES